MRFNRRQVLAGMGALGGLGVTGLPARRGFAQDSNALVIPTLGGVWEQFWRDQVVPAFQERVPDAEITLDVGNGRVYTANLRVAGVENPPYSVVMTNEVFASVLRKEGFFEQLDLSRLPSYADLYPIARATDDWGAVATVSPIGIGYRTDLVSTPPTRWQDLWENPEFRGKIGLYNIANSAGKMTVLLASQIFGSDQYDLDAGFAALTELGPVIQVDFNLSTAMAAGEIVVAPFDFGEISRLRNQGLPVDCIIPEEGMLAFDQTLNICAHGAAKDLAYEYCEFLLSPEVQTLLMAEFFTSPANSKVVVPPELQADVPVSGEAMAGILQWDWDFVNEKATELSERWARSVQ